MRDIILYAKDESGITPEELRAALAEMLGELGNTRKTLLLPPDYTRLHSKGGDIASMLYQLLEDKNADTKVLPALGTHDPATDSEREAFFSGIPKEKFLVHDWRNGVVKIGEVPADFVRDVSGGIIDEPFEVEVNRELCEGGFDAVFSIGQVVPHEVVGMANYTKNILVGTGGSGMINKSHILGAMYGMERMMGRTDTPVRAVFDYAEKQFLSKLPIIYILTVTTNGPDGVILHGLFIGKSRAVYEKACELSREKNLIYVERPLKKAVVWLDPGEFKSTWLGNKAIYRTRLAMADGGELIILAPGVRRFGEDMENDRLIRKFGYVGRDKVLELYRTEPELQNNQSVAATLVHGSSDGRFTVTYCTEHLTKDEVEGVGFRYMPLRGALLMYDPKSLRPGWNERTDGELYFIENPALGLWADKARMC